MPAWWRAALGAGQAPSADQEAAICAPPTGRQTVNAGAGTGKTSTLALRALYLIEAGHLRADQIVVVTFTKKAAAEIGSRIADTMDRALAAGAPFAAESGGVYCTTIHALAAGILREFAFEFGWAAPPRAIGDGEAYGIFHAAFRALLDGRLAVDTSVFPIAEINLDILERDLGRLALRLKNHGVSPAAFAARALQQSTALGEQSWGQLWSPGKDGKRIRLAPKVAYVAAERVSEAENERRNVRVVAALFADFDRRLEELGAATYGDLIGRTTQLLRERPELVQRLRARWRYLLLDESQDTSDIQLRLIDTLFGAPGDTGAAGMMPVGDARQAIYGFNGADERVMQRIAQDADASHPLSVNRRSSQEIVDAAAAVLAAAGIGDATTPRLQASAGACGLASVRVERFGRDGETIKAHVACESEAIATEVARLLADEAAGPSDIAILLRRRTHAAAYVRALNVRGIAAALDRRNGLFVADEIRDVLAWMALVLDVSDRRAAVRILQSPLCGLNDASMIALAEDGEWLTALLRGSMRDDLDRDTRERLDQLRLRLDALLPAVGLPLATAVTRIVGELPVAASYARLGEAVGAQAVANLRGFEELASAFAADHPGARLRDFIADVARRIRYDDDQQEAELELDGVRVLTIHQAKGLEWPYVFVACSTKHQYAGAEPTDRVVGYDLVSGAFALKNDIDGRETFRWQMLAEEHDAMNGQRLEPAPRKTLAAREGARVFYVALTRARRRVYVTAPVPPGANTAVGHIDAITTWAESVEAGANLRFARTGEVASNDEAPSNGAAAAAKRTRLIALDRAPAPMPAAPTVRSRVSFTAISAYQTCPRMARYRYRLMLPDLHAGRAPLTGLDPAEAPTAGNAARLGSLTHRTLELWGRAAIEQRPLALAVAFAQARAEFADASADEVARAQAGAAHAAAALATFTLIAVETPFAIAAGGTTVEGVVDLIARDPDGLLWVIDYKTGRSDDAHYAVQLALYRRAVAARYPAENEVRAAILRLSPRAAVFAAGSVPGDAELDAAVEAVGAFDSDVPSVGPWCDRCAYRSSPCLAPLERAPSPARAGAWAERFP